MNPEFNESPDSFTHARAIILLDIPIDFFPNALGKIRAYRLPVLALYCHDCYIALAFSGNALARVIAVKKIFVVEVWHNVAWYEVVLGQAFSIALYLGAGLICYLGLAFFYRQRQRKLDEAGKQRLYQ